MRACISGKFLGRLLDEPTNRRTDEPATFAVASESDTAVRAGGHEAIRKTKYRAECNAKAQRVNFSCRGIFTGWKACGASLSFPSSTRECLVGEVALRPGEAGGKRETGFPACVWTGHGLERPCHFSRTFAGVRNTERVLFPCAPHRRKFVFGGVAQFQ